MSIEDLTSMNFERMISFNYDPLRTAVEHIIKILDSHHAVFSKLQDNSALLDSTDSEEEERKIQQQAKRDKNLTEPIHKRLNHHEKMITELNKELSNMQRMNRLNTVLNTPKGGQTTGSNLAKRVTLSNIQIAMSGKNQGPTHQRDNSLSSSHNNQSEDFTMFLQKVANDLREIELNNPTVFGQSNLGIDKIDENDPGQTAMNVIFDYRMQHVLFQLRNDILENVFKKMEGVEQKFSGEIAKISNLLDQELGINIGENDLVIEEDEEQNDKDSVSSFNNSQIIHDKNTLGSNTHSRKVSQMTVNINVDSVQQQNDQPTAQDQQPYKIKTDNLMPQPNSQHQTLASGRGHYHSTQNATSLFAPGNLDKNQAQRKSIRILDRQNQAQKTINDLNTKVDSLQKYIMKLNDYHETNNMKTYSIPQMSKQIESLNSMIDSKANTLDLKKVFPRLHEVQERLDQKDEKNDHVDKQIRDIESLINNLQRQNNHRMLQIEAKQDLFDKDLIEVKKDIDIKFGSKNLLNFGNSSPDGLQVEIMDEVRVMVDQKFGNLQGLIEQVRNQFSISIQSHDAQLLNKVDKKQLEDTHEKFSVQLEKFMANTVKKFMDRNETKKTFKMFEKQLKNIFDIIIAKFEEQDTNDAMGAKKPLGGWSCISCQKNITNMAGAIAEYQITGKFPFRDPTDRLNNVGAGFSKMLSSMRPETQKNDNNSRPFSKLGTSVSQTSLRQNLSTAAQNEKRSLDDKKNIYHTMSQQHIRIASPGDQGYTSDEGGLQIYSHGAKYQPISQQITLPATHGTNTLTSSIIQSRTHGNSLNQDMIQTLKIDEVHSAEKQIQSSTMPSLKLKRPQQKKI